MTAEAPPTTRGLGSDKFIVGGQTLDHSKTIPTMPIPLTSPLLRCGRAF